MNLKDAGDKTGAKKHTCDKCQQFVSKETYLKWVDNTDFSEGYPIGDPLLCEDCG